MPSETHGSVARGVGFDAEAWLVAHERFIRATAEGMLFRLRYRSPRSNLQTAELINDVVQEFWEQAYFDQNGFREKAETKGYLAKCIRNRVIDWHRKNDREQTWSQYLNGSNGDDIPDHEAVERRAGTAGFRAVAGVWRHGGALAKCLGEDELIANLEPDMRTRCLLPRLRDTMRAGILPALERLARHDRTLASRLKHPVMRPVLDALLVRIDILDTLVRDSRDISKEATVEAEELSRQLAVNVRTIQNRRSDWLRDLRRLLRDELELVRRGVRGLYPELRPR